MQRKSFLKKLSQLSIEEDNPRSTRLMGLCTNLVVPPPHVRHDQGQSIYSYSSLTNVEYTHYIIEQHLEKEAKKKGC